MNLVEEVRTMYYEENLTIGEIAGALRQSPNVIYSILFKRKSSS